MVETNGDNVMLTIPVLAMLAFSVRLRSPNNDNYRHYFWFDLENICRICWRTPRMASTPPPMTFSVAASGLRYLFDSFPPLPRQLFLIIFFSSCQACVGIALTNQFHKWSHGNDLPAIVEFLQRNWIILPKENHSTLLDYPLICFVQMPHIFFLQIFITALPLTTIIASLRAG